MSKTLILGLGNTLLRDDGVGVRVVEKLQAEGVKAEVRNGATLGLSLFEILTKCEKALVVDAVDMGKAPGTMACFSAQEILALPESKNFSLHEIGLLEVLKIGQTLNEEFRKVTIIGIQPQDLRQGESLSPEVEKVIPQVIEMIKKEVN
jgi:hydrogenase maturation protease